MGFTPFKRVPKPKQDQAVDATQGAFPKIFKTQESARRFLFQLILPPSRAWCFVSVGKNASTSTLHALYQAEFGHPLTADLTVLNDINPSAAVHTLPDHGIFGRALWQGMSAQDVRNDSKISERICVVRNPLDRAISAFRYLCKSHRDRARWFARERFLLDAVMGFDWDNHPDTPEGLGLFLRFVDWQIQTMGTEYVNGHWRPQADFIRPAVFRPTLTGRMEEMGAYYKALYSRLELEPPPEPHWENRQPIQDTHDLITPEITALCARVYARDYDVFEYARP